MLGIHEGIAGLLRNRKGAAQLYIHFAGLGLTLLSVFLCFSHKEEDKPSPMVIGWDSQPRLPFSRTLAWAAVLHSKTAVFHWLQMPLKKRESIVLGGALAFWKELGDCVSDWELFSFLEP